MPGGAYGVYEIRIASQINLRSRATARTNGLSVRFATRRKYLATARLRNRAASDQWPRPRTEHTWAANLHRKLTLRHWARFAAKNKRREPEFFFGGETVSGSFFSALWKKIKFEFRRGATFAAENNPKPWRYFSAEPAFFFSAAPPEKTANSNSDLVLISPPKTPELWRFFW